MSISSDTPTISKTKIKLKMNVFSKTSSMRSTEITIKYLGYHLIIYNRYEVERLHKKTEYLKRFYGDDWETPKKDYDHEDEVNLTD